MLSRKSSVNNILVRKNVLKYWKLLNYSVWEPPCRWSQLTQEEVEERGESSIFKTAKIKKLQNIYAIFKIFSTWYFCFQKYCTILNIFEIFRMWAALPVIPTYTRGGRGEGGVSELHNPTKLFHHFTETSSSPKTILLEIRLLMHWYFIAKKLQYSRLYIQWGFLYPPKCKAIKTEKKPTLQLWLWIFTKLQK